MDDLADLQTLAIAAAIGFLIGFQREWRDVEEAKQSSFAGARTFSLIGFLGGAAGLIGDGAMVIAAGLAAVAALTVAAYWVQATSAPGLGGTTEVAVLATYLLGALATRGEPALAAAGGVGVAILLALKPAVERWATAMEPAEIGAALRFLAISVIVLPILPDQGYGPYEALNPRSIWWMVVLISGLSFLGYWLAKLYGSHGVLVTGLVGGLASSTATTLSLSRLVRDGSASERAGAAGIVAANVVMFARVAALLVAVSTEVLAAVWPALAAAGAAGLAAAFLLWRGERRDAEGEAERKMDLGNPMALRPALVFAALLAVITLASRYASDRFGDIGLYAVALVTGLADVDALTLTAGRQAGGETGVEAAGVAVMLAVASNTVVKGVMASAIAGAATAARLWAAFAASLLAGGAALALTVFA